MGTRSPSSPDDAADKDAKRKPTTVRSSRDGELPSLKRSRYDDDDTASDEDRRKHRSRRGDYRNEDRRTHRKGDFSPSPERRPRNRNGAGQDSRSEKHREIRRDRISRNSPPENRRDTRRERASPHRSRRGSDDSDGQSPSRYGRKGGHADRVSAKNNEHASSPDRKLGNLNVEIETRGLNLPDDTADKGMKRKSSNLKNPSDGELPSLKKSRYDEDETTSDEDGRKRRSQRRDYHDKDQRNPREDDFSPFLERKSRDRNGARQEGHAGDKVSTKRIELASSPDRKHGDVDEDNEKWESGVHRDQPKHEAKMVADQKRDRSPSLERIGRRDDRRREYSSSPVRTHRRDDRLPSPSRKRRESRSPLHHRDRGKYDGDRNLDRKKRNFSRDEDRVALRDAQASDQDDRAWGRNGKVHGNDDRSKDADRNAGVHVIDRDRGRVNPDRLAGEKDTKMDERDDDVLDRYVGDGMHDKNDLQRQKQGRASQRQRNEEVHNSADEDRRKDRSRRSEDDNDNQRSRRSRGGDRQNKHMTWADKVDEDELAGKDRRDSVELKKHVKHAKILHHKKELHSAGKETKDPKSNIPAANANAEQLQGRSGGVYIPPFKLAQMMKEIQDKSGVEYQRMTWDALRKSINGLVNKVNASNIKNIIPELLAENLIRGRGLFARSCMKSQMASPLFTHVFAALVAVVNTKFPELGELLLKRVILQFRRALRRNDKPLLLAAARFIAHLVNQQVAHEVVALEVLMVLLENPTDDSVEVSVGFVKECGAILQDLAPQGLHGIFERFRGILHEGEIDKRVQFMIEGLFAIRKSGFQGHPAVIPELDLVEQEDQFTHEISLSEDLDAEMSLDIFQADPNFLENEKKYEGIKRDILGEESSDDNGEKGSGESSDDEDDDDDEDEEAEFQKMQIKDETETNLVNLRRTIYLTIMSSVDFEEAGHKLLKIKLESGQEMELNIMLLECCSQERTYLRYYGLLGQRFCMINKIYQENFDTCFVNQYSMIHRLETNKLRNVAKFFAHLLGTDALPWNVLEYIKLTEEDTTSSSRIFIKILFQELSEHLGLRKLNEKLNDSDNQGWINGIFPIDNPKNTRFAINFFTSIGLGGITDNLREHLKKMPRLIMQQQRQVASESDSSDSDDTSESESSSSESDSESSSSGSESESESESKSDSDSRKKRKRR